MLIGKTHIKAWDTNLALVLASPLVVLLIGNLAARLFAAWLGQWAWVGVSLVYWGSLALMVAAFGGLGHVRRWLQPWHGSLWWLALALVVGLIGFPLLLIPNWQVLTPWPMVVAWLVFGAINAFCEEVYWRGFFLDASAALPRGLSVAYMTVLFVILHPLMWGVFSTAQQFDPANPLGLAPFLIIAVVLSLSFSALYLRTHSLRLAILSHFLSDLGSLSIFVFMNLVTIR